MLREGGEVGGGVSQANLKSVELLMLQRVVYPVWVAHHMIITSHDDHMM